MPRLGEIFGWSENPFYQAFDANRNSIVGGLTNMGADPLNPWKGMGQGFQQGAKLDIYEAEKEAEQQQLNQTAEWLKANYPQYAGLPPAEGFRAALAEMGRTQGGANLTAEQRNWMFGQENPEFMDFLGGSNRQNISLTPQWAQDEQGNWHMLQTSSTGELVQAQTPEGLRLADPRTLNAERSAGTAFGREVAGVQFNLPQAQLARDTALQAVENVRAQSAGMAEHFGNVMGVPQQWTAAWPGSAKANFQVEAERAISQSFMQAREGLKGGGQITDFEGRKAEEAITAMRLALEKGNQAAFIKAMNEFETYIKAGYAKLEQQAASMPSYGGGQPAPAAGGGFTILGVE